MEASYSGEFFVSFWFFSVYFIEFYNVIINYLALSYNKYVFILYFNDSRRTFFVKNKENDVNWYVVRFFTVVALTNLLVAGKSCFCEQFATL